MAKTKENIIEINPFTNDEMEYLHLCLNHLILKLDDKNITPYNFKLFEIRKKIDLLLLSEKRILNKEGDFEDEEDMLF